MEADYLPYFAGSSSSFPVPTSRRRRLGRSGGVVVINFPRRCIDDTAPDDFDPERNLGINCPGRKRRGLSQEEMRACGPRVHRRTCALRHPGRVLPAGSVSEAGRVLPAGSVSEAGHDRVLRPQGSDLQLHIAQALPAQALPAQALRQEVLPRSRRLGMRHPRLLRAGPGELSSRLATSLGAALSLTTS